MKRTLVVLVIVLAACSGSSSDEPAASASQLAIVMPDGNIAVFDPVTEILTDLTTDAGEGRFYAQPTWSPDGQQVAVSVSAAATSGPGIQAEGSIVRVAHQAQAAGGSAIHLIPTDGGPPTVISIPFAAFYLYWAPDGTHLAFLGNDTTQGQLGVGIVDVSAGRAEVVDSGQPYYFAWSPESDRMLVHRADRELFFLSIDGTQQVVGPSPGGFTAPSWIGDTLMVGWDDGSGPATRLVSPDGSLLEAGVPYSDAIAFGLNPDERRFAFIDAAAATNPFNLGALVVASPSGHTTVADEAAAFFWDASGERLLYLTPEFEADAFALRWNVWDGTTSHNYESFLPTATVVQQYLQFFSQYANSLSFFSPDGSSFTFAGRIDGRGEGIWIQDIESGGLAERVGPGEFSSWAP